MFYHSQHYFPMPNSVRYLFDCMVNYDISTATHLYRVKNIAVHFALGLKFSPRILQDIADAAILHDIGKLKVPRHILNKPGNLTGDEWEIIKKHSQFGFDILRPVEELQHILEAVLYHHEKFNGTGYPEGRKGEDIPLISRILSIADVYESLTSNRPYRKAMEAREALAIIQDERGSHFDPWLTDAFLLLMTGCN